MFPPVSQVATNDSQVVVGSLTGFRSNRRLTDLYCCISYLLLILSLLAVVLYNSKSSVSGFDKLRDCCHNPCTGVNKFLYYPSPTLDRSVCVSHCPDVAGVPLSCYPNMRFQECPRSISGLVTDYELGICHHPDAQIPLLSIGKVLNRSIFHSREEILRCLFVVAGVGLFIALTTLIVPSLVYFYVVVFELVMFGVSVLCFWRFFTGRLHYLPTPAHGFYKGSPFTLGFAVFFLVSSLISTCILISRLSHLSRSVKIIRLAREVLKSNPLMVLDAAILTALTIGAFLLNYWLYGKIQSFGYLDENERGLFQYKTGVIVNLLRVLLGIEILWTHGFLISLSHFVSESKATLWYYTPLLGTDIWYSIITTIRLVFWHFGTICFGSCYAYHSQTITNSINKANKKVNIDEDYQVLCSCHNRYLKYLSIYAFIPTVLEGLPFWPANYKFSPIKSTAERMYPFLYMQGSYFTNSLKFFLSVLSILVVFSLLVWRQPEIYFNLKTLGIPLLVRSWLFRWRGLWGIRLGGFGGI